MRSSSGSPRARPPRRCKADPVIAEDAELSAVVTAAAIAESIQRMDVVPRAVRDAVNVLEPIIECLPQSEVFLVSDPAIGAWRSLRAADPGLYRLYRRRVLRGSDRALVDELDALVGPPAAAPARELRLLTVPELLARPTPGWLIARLLPARGFGVVYGDAGSGKTFVVLDAAFSIVRNEQWFDQETNPGGVIYVAAEGRLRDRIAAYIAWCGLHDHDLRLLRVIEEAVDLSGPTPDLDQLMNLVIAAAREVGVVALVVIDTVARVLAGADENSGEHMGRFLTAMKRIEEATGGLVLCVHHAGKDTTRGARGHSSLRGAADVEIEVRRGEGGIRVAKWTKLRDAEDGAEFAFRLESVAFGTNGSGEGSCVVVPVSTPPRAGTDRQRRLSDGGQVCLQALQAALDEAGEVLPETSAAPRGIRAAREPRWRAAYARLQPIEEGLAPDDAKKEKNAQRMRFTRGLEQLVAKKVIQGTGGYWWIA